MATTKASSGTRARVRKNRASSTTPVTPNRTEVTMAPPVGRGEALPSGTTKPGIHVVPERVLAVEDLFRPGISPENFLALPFIRDYTRAERKTSGLVGRCFWSPQPESSDYAEACRAGARYAAAYLIHAQASDDPISLAYILNDMVQRGKQRDGYMVGFAGVMKAFLMSAARIAGTGEIMRYLRRREASELSPGAV